MSRWPSIADRFWSYADKSDGCWNWLSWTRRTGYPYGLFRYSVDGRQIRTSAHRFAWELTHGPIPDGLCICHHCDNPRCVRPDHLFIGTVADNVRDRDVKGRGRLASTQRGERHHRAKLTAETAREIYRRANAGESQRVLSREFAIDPSVVSDIKRGVQWKDATAGLR